MRVTVSVCALIIAAAPIASGQLCPGDFDNDDVVGINEIILTVNSALAGCPAPSARFTDNDDGTIVDRHTRLVWEKKGELDGFSHPDNAHDADNEFQWAGLCENSQAWCQPTAEAANLCATNAEYPTTACRQCRNNEGSCLYAGETIWSWVTSLNSSRFAGQSDWRVPTRSELESIVDYEARNEPSVSAAFHTTSCEGSCTDIVSRDCSCTASRSYWSASSGRKFAGEREGSAYIVDFFNGFLRVGAYDDNIRARAVRGGS